MSGAIIAKQCFVEGCKHPFSVLDFGIKQLELINSMMTGNDQDICKIIWSFRLNGKQNSKCLRMKIETNLFKRVTVGALIIIYMYHCFVIVDTLDDDEDFDEASADNNKDENQHCTEGEDCTKAKVQVSQRKFFDAVSDQCVKYMYIESMLYVNIEWQDAV
jgi:hypothetical protein